MREFKFRAWDKKNSVLHCAESVKKHFYLDELIDSENYDLLQYTGLKDKNGVEIYEGDYLSLIVFEDNQEYKGPVVFAKGGFCFEVELEGHKYKVPFNSFSESRTSEILEVIGNIHENPELLEVQG